MISFLKTYLIIEVLILFKQVGKFMKKISVAIPTYFSSKFITDTINSLKDNKIVNEIIICDDSEDKEEYSRLVNLVSSLLENSDINLNIQKNKSKLEGFKNKYKCVSLASNDFVYQLDHDNIANKKTLDKISNLDIKSIDKEQLFIPSKIIMFKKNKYEYIFKPSYNVKYLNKSLIFDSVFIKDYIDTNNNFLLKKNVSWLFNTGNQFFYRDAYLSNLEKGLELSKTTLSACSFGMAYFWLSSGNKICIAEFLSHYHRLHEDSAWVKEGEKVVNSVNYFKAEILNI